METCRSCGCKGIRTCLICEEQFGIKKPTIVERNINSYTYCVQCNKCWPGWNVQNNHPNHTGESIEFPGVHVQLNFLSDSEEKLLLNGIGKIPWDQSQSGRRKQNFGPKCNFKKHKLSLGNFRGFPAFSRFVQDKFKAVSILEDFQTIEQCSLEYDPKRGASIDPHVDDCWIWGERVVTVNLLSESVLTLIRNKHPERYNLDQVQHYPSVLKKDGSRDTSGDCFVPANESEESYIVRVPMPRRSLLVLYNSARYEWEHMVLREDINETRICIAYREFTPTYLPGGEKCLQGKDVLDVAKIFIENT